VPGDVIPIGARLKQHRVERGLTQAQAARELDVARTAYRLWEMEAARPSPDRWRSIAKWLGLSVTALLLADELIDEEEAENAELAASALSLTMNGWDAESAASAGDFFSQERVMIDDHERSGSISLDYATGLRRVLTRIRDATMDDARSTWHPGHFVKRFPTTPFAPALCRAALTATAIGIPSDSFDDALLLTSELVTNSVRHSRSDWVEVGMALTASRLRVEVSDEDSRPIRPRTQDSGWGLVLVGVLATRWGVERRRNGKSIWIELDLAHPTPDT
jgi:transcriptional regulator with XRE-family HTH domain